RRATNIEGQCHLGLSENAAGSVWPPSGEATIAPAATPENRLQYVAHWPIDANSVDLAAL
ncbi:MAG: hypothetical protein R6V07_07320, partial [Armatimonadota bacterium]